MGCQDTAKWFRFYGSTQLDAGVNIRFYGGNFPCPRHDFCGKALIGGKRFYVPESCPMASGNGGRGPVLSKRGGTLPPTPNLEGGIPALPTPSLVQDRVPPPSGCITKSTVSDGVTSQGPSPQPDPGGGTPHSKVREGVPYPPVKKMSGGIPTPSPKSEGGIPSPLVLRKTGYLPPSGCSCAGAASCGITPERSFREWLSGGWDTPSLPYEWGVPPPPLQKMRGGYLPYLPPLLEKTGYHPPIA